MCLCSWKGRCVGWVVWQPGWGRTFENHREFTGIKHSTPSQLNVHVSIHTAHVKLSADDCITYSVVDSRADQDLLCRNLRKIGDWCERWLMQINFSKTYSLPVTRKRNILDYGYHILSNCLERCTDTKYLGVHITSNLKWDKHIEYTCAKAFKKLCFLHRKLGRSSSTVNLMTYKTLVCPSLEYASAVWDPYLEKTYKQLKEYSGSPRILFWVIIDVNRQFQRCLKH